MNNRIGILGGTFNPVHHAHLLLAQEAWFQLRLSKVLLIPALRNPLRDDHRELASEYDRLAMLRLAVLGDSRLSVSDCEIRRGGASYTIDTLEELAERGSGSQLYLLMGADAAMTLGQWKDIGQYSGLCTIAICDRPGSHSFACELPEFLKTLNLKWQYLELPALAISASEIRSRIRHKAPVKYLVPNQVANYIKERGLYQP